MYRIESRKEEKMTDSYLTTMYVVDTECDIYGSFCPPEPECGASVSIEDVRVRCETPADGISIYELVASCPKIMEDIEETVCEHLAENNWEL